jgi:nucleotide-binding universal stress UspA family protein
MIGYQKVLVPVSGKFRLERAKQALEHALQIVRKNGEIGFLHCVDEVPFLITMEEHRKLFTQDTREAEKLFNPLVERVRNAGIACSVHIVEGSPVTHIPSFASAKQFNVVVMCTDGDAEPVKLSMGSIAMRVFQYLDVPLFIVH